MDTLLRSDCPELSLLAAGKVRDIYIVDKYLLLVATDRISAYDKVMANGVPGKGRILNKISEFWFTYLCIGRQSIVPCHLVTTDLDQMPKNVQKYRAQLEGRCMLVKRLKVLPIEAIVRGYLAGSAWKEYKTHGTVSSVPVDQGMNEFDKFREPIFTPSTKAALGEHDENITVEEMRRIFASQNISEKIADQVVNASIALYKAASAYAAECGITIADTKFEFGIDENNTLHLVDEALTPDSSRFWIIEDGKRVGIDKQYLRDYLINNYISVESIPQNVIVPNAVVSEIHRLYLKAQEKLTHQSRE